MSRRSARAVAFCLVALVASVGCADDAMLERTQRNMGKLRSLRGVLVEHGVLPSGEMRSEVRYRKPDQFISRVLSPESYAGVTIAVAHGQLVLFYPKANYAVVFDSMPATTAEGAQRLIARAYKHDQSTFRYELGGGGTVAKLPVVNLSYTAKHQGHAHVSGMVQVYDKVSLPLAGKLHFIGGAEYGYRYESVELNTDLAEADFTVALPKNVILSRWDLGSPGVPEPDMRSLANFGIATPTLPPGFTLERIVRQEGPVPAFTTIYRSGDAWLLLSMWKDLGIAPASEDHGIPVSLPSGKGRLVVGPAISSYTFSLRGTKYVLTANLPFDELLEVARTID